MSQLPWLTSSTSKELRNMLMTCKHSTLFNIHIVSCSIFYFYCATILGILIHAGLHTHTNMNWTILQYQKIFCLSQNLR